MNRLKISIFNVSNRVLLDFLQIFISNDTIYYKDAKGAMYVLLNFIMATSVP